MKRYNRRLTHSIAFNESVVDIEKIYIEDFEHPDGEWVRYKDVNLWIRGKRKPPLMTIKSIDKCNCFHMSKLKEPLWYCPAHGYKKL